MSSNFANFWQKHTPGNVKQRNINSDSAPHLNFMCSTIFTAYNTASNIRDTTLRCPRPVATVRCLSPVGASCRSISTVGPGP